MKRWIALLLTLALCLSVAGPALAADARETDFFTDRDHADVDFADMAYEEVDMEAELAKMEALRTLGKTAGNEDAVLEGFLEVMDDVTWALTMDTLAYIYSCQDVDDEQAQLDYQQAEKNVTDIMDAALELLRDLLNSPCAGTFDEVLTEEEREAYADYTPLTQEQKDLDEQITALTTQFWTLDNTEYTVAFEDEEWSDTELMMLYYYDYIDYDTYTQLSRAIAKTENEAKGPLYLELVELRKKLAATYDYDSFAQYAYENNYARDFTLEEAAQFEAAVKEYIAPLFWEISALYSAESYRDVFSQEFTGEEILDKIAPYIPSLSSELTESFGYMRSHGLYDIEAAESKAAQGFTTSLYSYAAPFFYNSPSGNVQDLTTAIHEFGHYNNAYYEDPGLMLDSKSTDICEVHSQALELLFTRFYPDLFGSDGEAVELYILQNLLYSIVDGALQDELQQYVYATDNVTVSQINQKYRQLCGEYGFVDPDDERTEMYSWDLYPHTFEVPMYYIAYAVSAAGALSFWLDAQKDYCKGVDDYLKFTALTTEYDFQESFEAVGMESPLSPTYLSDLADALRSHLDVDAKLADLPVVGYFRDVKADDWFVDAVDFVYSFGLMQGTTSPAVFAPKQEMTRGELVTILYRAEDQPEAEATVTFSDVAEDDWYTDAVNWAVAEGVSRGYGGAEAGRFGPKDLLTREQLVTILARYAELEWDADLSEWSDLTRYADYEQVSVYAEDAMSWAVATGIITTTGTGGDLALSPQRVATRAEAAAMLTRFFTAIMGEG